MARADISCRRIWRYLALMMACLMLFLVPTACDFSDGTGFPPLDTITTSSGDTGPTSATTQEGTPPPALTVALPMDAEGLEALRLLYLAKSSGLISQESGQYIGLQVQPEDLRQFDSGLQLNLIAVPAATGATGEMLEIWNSSANLPDIIYCRSAAESIGLARCRDLSGYLYDSDLLSAARVSIPAIENCRAGEALYAVPFMASVPVIYCNSTLISQLQLTPPDGSWTWNEWLAFAAQSQAAIDAAGLSASPASLAELGDSERLLTERLGKALFVLANPADYLAWLPLSLTDDAGWALWDGRRFAYDAPAFDEAVAWLTDNDLAGYSMIHLSDDERTAAFNTQDPVRSGRVLMWIGDSADLDVWRQAGLQVIACQLPAGLTAADSGEAPVIKPAMPMVIRSLVVSTDCHEPELAADLSAFIALDADARLMQSRYRLYSGLVPLLRDEFVRQTLVGAQADWPWLLTATNLLNNSACSDQQTVAHWDAAIEASLGAHGADLLLAANDAERSQVIAQMLEAADQALLED